MKAKMKCCLVSIVLMAAVATAQGMVWDLADETYGSGAGQVSFTGSYSWPWSDVPSQTLHDGYASISTGPGVDYACRANGTINLPTAQWRMDVTMQLHNAMGFTFYLGDRDNPLTLSLMQVNAAYNETVAHPNVITDYNFRIADGGEIQPAGFDGSALHTYSFRWDGSVTKFYLDDAYVTTLIRDAGIDAGYEACEFGLGAALSAGPGSVDFYSMKIASVVPEPLTLTLLALGGLAGLRRR